MQSYLFRTKKKKPEGASFFVRTRSQPIRTIAKLPVRIKIRVEQGMSIHEKLKSRVIELKTLGMPREEIVSRLKISRKTVRKAIDTNKDSNR